MISHAQLERLGIAVPNILVPADRIAPEQWAVIACDQFTSEPSYWDETQAIVGAAPSTLNLIIPECRLEDNAGDRRAADVRRSMRETLARGDLRELPPGFIFVNRSTPFAPSRRGLVLAIDLEAYDFAQGSASLIRPTEGTIRDRLPPRMVIRRGAVLDLPHILLLIDDPDDAVMKAAAAAAGNLIYDFDLMQNGGHLAGRFIGEDALEPLADALESALRSGNLLFAVGDGNHSLAAAREIWREKKAAGAPLQHPSRWALAEVENIHDPGLYFHPIHRVLFNVKPRDLEAHLEAQLGACRGKTGKIATVSSRGRSNWDFEVPENRLAVEPLQAALDSYLESRPEASIDYVHGEDSAAALAAASPNRVGLLLPNLEKDRFFRRIAEVGPYPRKTFSIGEAVEKRYYFESRRLEA